MPRIKKAAVEPIAETVSETQTAETEAAVVAADEAKAEPKKTTRKRAVKAAEEKAEAAPKRTRGRKKATVDTAAEAKGETPKAEAPKKTTAGKDETRVSVKIQFGGRDFSTEEILEKAKAAFAVSNEGVEIKTIELYVNADDRAAYYVVNGQVPENNKIDL